MRLLNALLLITCLGTCAHAQQLPLTAFEQQDKLGNLQQKLADYAADIQKTGSFQTQLFNASKSSFYSFATTLPTDGNLITKLQPVITKNKNCRPL